MTRRRVGALVAMALIAGTLAITGGIALAADPKPRLTASLAGASELPPADDGTGGFRMTVDASDGEVCFKVQFRGTGTPNRAHIHAGDAATNGAIVIPLFELREDPTDPRHDVLEASRSLSGCVPADPALLADITANPGNYYCNLHNARFPAGSMRGQLAT